MQGHRHQRCQRIQINASAGVALSIKNYTLFMIPKPRFERLSSNMQSTDTNQQTWFQPHHLAGFATEPKELKLKLSVETRNHGEVVIVHCEGRIVYRDEVAALANVAGDVLHSGGKLVLDLSGVVSIDSAGIGELVSLQMQAQGQKAVLKVASPSPLVRDLLDLTNVNSLLQVYSTLSEALEALELSEVCADC